MPHLTANTSPVAEAAPFEHQRGIVHRDLKPANVLIKTQIRPLTNCDGRGIILRQL